MTTADTLRAAAARLREVAEATYSGPWTPIVDSRYGIQSAVSTPSGQHISMSVNSIEDYRGAETAAYIATMSPPVALAMADLLDATAEHVASHDCEAHCELDGCDQVKAALTLATAVLTPTDPDVSRVRDHMNKES